VSKRRKSSSSRSRRRPSKPPTVGLTRRELAALLSRDRAAGPVHMQTITKWEQAGMPTAERGRKGKPSRYLEADVRAWLDAREKSAQTSGVVDLARERARKERAQAMVAEQTFAARTRQLLPREEVEKAWSGLVAAVRTKLLALPPALADQVHQTALLDGVDGVEQVLQAAVLDVLRELAGGASSNGNGNGNYAAAAPAGQAADNLAAAK
jgi:phage terminase Nu1 subunit (DNA packaging protein)